MGLCLKIACHIPEQTLVKKPPRETGTFGENSHYKKTSRRHFLKKVARCKSPHFLVLKRLVQILIVEQM